MTDIANMLMPENDLKTWRQLPRTMRDFAQATLAENIRMLKANVEYRYRSGEEARSVFLFNEEWYNTDPPVAFVLGEQKFAGVLIDVTEYHHLETVNGVEQWIVFVDVPESAK